jgi:hypothetical protein
MEYGRPGQQRDLLTLIAIYRDPAAYGIPADVAERNQRLQGTAFKDHPAYLEEWRPWPTRRSIARAGRRKQDDKPIHVHALRRRCGRCRDVGTMVNQGHAKLAFFHILMLRRAPGMECLR